MKQGTLFADRYRIIKEIGRGGMGAIYKAQDLKINETVALKLLKHDLQNELDVIKRFVREIKLALKITHENVVRIYDIGEIENTHYISMEYIDGPELKELVDQRGAFPLAEGLEIVTQICCGLALAHKKGIIHRDMKSQNVLLDTFNTVKIVDFGIAKVEQSTSQTEGVTQEGVVIGTPEYMSPEQALGQPIDIRTDIYSLGIIMFELFTGQVPFQDDSALKVLLKQIKATPPVPSQLNNTIPPTLDRIILKAMAKDLEQRYQMVEDLQADIEHLDLSDTVPVSATAANKDDQGSADQAEVEALFQKGMTLFNQRQYSEALAFFEQVVVRDPKHPQAYDYIEIAGAQIAKVASVARLLAEGEQNFNQQNYQQAVSLFQEVLTNSPDNPQAQIGLKKALAALEEAGQESPPATPEPHEYQTAFSSPEMDDFERGKYYYEHQNYQEALDIFQNILAENPNHSECFELLEITKAALAARQEIEHHFLTARRLYQEGDLEACHAELTVTLDYDPEHQEALNLLEQIKKGPYHPAKDAAGTTPEEGATDESAVPLTKNPLFAKHLSEIQNLIKEKKLVEAQLILKQLKPRFPHNKAEIERYIRKLQQEELKHFIAEHMNKGLDLMKQERYRQALATFTKIIEREPKSIKARTFIDQCREKIAEDQKSQEMLKRAKLAPKEGESQTLTPVRPKRKSGLWIGLSVVVGIALLGGLFFYPQLKPKLSSYFKGRGMALYSNKEFEAAAAAFQHAYDLFPQPELLEKRAEALYQAGSDREALQLLNQLIQEGHDKPAYFYLLGKIYQQKGDVEKALAAYNQTVQKDPRNAQAFEALGSLYEPLEKWSLVIRNYQKSLKLKPQQPTLEYKLAQAFIASSDYNSARYHLQNLTNKHSTFGKAFSELGALYTKQGRYQSAISIMEKHPSFASGDAELYYHLGEAYEKLSRSRKGSQWRAAITKASEYYHKGFIIDPGYADIVHKLGHVYKARRDYNNMLLIYTQYLADFPDDVAIHMELGSLYQRRKQYGPAFDHFNKAVSLDSKNYRAWNKLGYLHQKTGNRKDARIAYHHSLEINPHQSDIKRRYNSLQ